MKVLVTGADGYIGRALVARLLSNDIDSVLGAIPVNVVLIDQHFGEPYRDARVTALQGDIADPDLLHQATDGVDLVFHLASMPGGAVMRNFSLGIKINLQATIALFESLRIRERKPRVVFASTIGVYGVPMPDVIDEETLPSPSMSYGAHKLMGEILVSDYSLRGFIDGCALRLPGIVARPKQPSGLLSAFISDLIRDLTAGEKFVCPVAADGKTWLMSRPCVIDNLLHAAALDPQVAVRQRVWLLPVLHASMGEVAAAIARIEGPHVLQNITYEPNATLQAQFASYPPLVCPKSVAAGFRHDGTLELLVKRALQ